MHGGTDHARQRLARGDARGGCAPPSPIPPRRAPRIWWTTIRGPGRPDGLVVADFTYVRLSTGVFVCTAFVIDAFAGRIVGWQCSASKQTAFVEASIRQAADLRAIDGNPLMGDTIHHSDAGGQGGFKWSSLHLDDGGVDGQASGLDEGVDGAFTDEVAGCAVAS